MCVGGVEVQRTAPGFVFRVKPNNVILSLSYEVVCNHIPLSMNSAPTANRMVAALRA